MLLIVGCEDAPQAAPALPVNALAATSRGLADLTPRLDPAARAALDRGNALFRAGKLQAARDAYRDAARAAPRDAAPYFGLHMVATRLGDARGAREARQMINRLAGAGTADSALAVPHHLAPAAGTTRAATPAR